MDIIASMIYYHLPLRELFPETRKERVHSEFDSEELFFSRYHLASLQPENYAYRGSLFRKERRVHIRGSPYMLPGIEIWHVVEHLDFV